MNRPEHLHITGECLKWNAYIELQAAKSVPKTTFMRRREVQDHVIMCVGSQLLHSALAVCSSGGAYPYLDELYKNTDGELLTESTRKYAKILLEACEERGVRDFPAICRIIPMARRMLKNTLPLCNFINESGESIRREHIAVLSSVVTDLKCEGLDALKSAESGTCNGFQAAVVRRIHDLGCSYVRTWFSEICGHKHFIHPEAIVAVAKCTTSDFVKQQYDELVATKAI